MKIRRAWIVVLVVMFAMIWGGGFLKTAMVSAADYPNRPITLIVATSAGGGYDLGARNIARFLPKHLPNKVDVVVQNMPGGGQMIAVHALYAAKPDGYMLGAFNGTGALMASFIRPGKIKFDVTKFNYLGMWQEDTRAIGLSNPVKVDTWKDLVSRSRQKPILCGTGGAGTSQHIDPLMIEAVSDLKLKYVHYDGSVQITPAMGRNEIEMQVGAIATVADLKEQGIGRLFCIFSNKRSDLAPDAPTALEVGMPEKQLQGLTESPFFGVNRLIAAPPAMDPKIVEILRKALWNTFQDPEYLAELKKMLGENNPMKGEEYLEVVKKKVKAAQENKELVEKLKF